MDLFTISPSTAKAAKSTQNPIKLIFFTFLELILCLMLPGDDPASRRVICVCIFYLTNT